MERVVTILSPEATRTTTLIAGEHGVYGPPPHRKKEGRAFKRLGKLQRPFEGHEPDGRSVAATVRRAQLDLSCCVEAQLCWFFNRDKCRDRL